MTPEQLLREGLAAYGLPADAAAIEGLEEFSRRLLERNQVMNLTAITDPCDVAALHLLDCAYLLTAADFRGKSVVYLVLVIGMTQLLGLLERRLRRSDKR